MIKAESPKGDKPAPPGHTKPVPPAGSKWSPARIAIEPRYLQVANELRAGIADGQFGSTGQLPTEGALCERYGVSRFTVREALRRLQAEGLIRRRRGSGTTIDTGARAQRQPISDIADLSHYAAGSRFDFAVTGPVTLAALAAAELGLQPGSRWIHLAGKRKLDASGPAVALTDVYVHADLATHVAGLRPGNQSLFSQLADAAGFRIGRVDQDLRAGAAGSREAIALGIPRRAPVLRIVRLYRDTDGRVVEASISVHPGDRFTYSMQIDPG